MTSRPCPQCSGYGTTIPHPCPECSGDGRVRTRRTISVKIPAGVDSGNRVPYLQTKKVDLVISSLSYTAERAKVIDFSLAYAVLRTVIAAPKSVNVKSLAELDGKTVGTVRGTTHDTQLTKEGPKGMKLVRYEDDATEGQAFLSGQVDIFSTAEMLVPQLDKKNPARQVEVKFILDSFKLCVGVKKGEDRLLAEVNKWVLANIKNGTLNGLNKKYFGSDLPELITKQQ